MACAATMINEVKMKYEEIYEETRREIRRNTKYGMNVVMYFYRREQNKYYICDNDYVTRYI